MVTMENMLLYLQITNLEEKGLEALNQERLAQEQAIHIQEDNIIT